MKQSINVAIVLFVMFQCLVLICSHEKSHKMKETKHNLKKEARFKEDVNQSNEKPQLNEAELTKDLNIQKPNLPDKMPHELEEELEALRENEGVINGGDSMTLPQQSETNIDDMINNDPILGKGNKSTDDGTYKEEFSPLDFF